MAKTKQRTQEIRRLALGAVNASPHGTYYGPSINFGGDGCDVLDFVATAEDGRRVIVRLNDWIKVGEAEAIRDRLAAIGEVATEGGRTGDVGEAQIVFRASREAQCASTGLLIVDSEDEWRDGMVVGCYLDETHGLDLLDE